MHGLILHKSNQIANLIIALVDTVPHTIIHAQVYFCESITM